MVEHNRSSSAGGSTVQRSLLPTQGAVLVSKRTSGAVRAKAFVSKRSSSVDGPERLSATQTAVLQGPQQLLQEQQCREPGLLLSTRAAVLDDQRVC